MTPGELRCRPVCVDLGPGPPAGELVRRVANWPGLVALLGAWAGGTAVLTSHPLAFPDSGTDPLAALDHHPELVGRADIVGGGWFGGLAFDGASRLAFHDHVVRLVAGRWQFEALHSDGRADELAARLAAWRAVLGAEPTPPAPWRVSKFDGPPATAHLAAVEQAVELIRAGQLYQVNVCTRLDAAFSGDPAAFFAAVAGQLQPRFGALLGGGPTSAVASFSPELFLRRRGREVSTSPIKGTLPRGSDPDWSGNAAALRRSAKDVAENVMIVDLVRNDLGRVCATGTVRVPALLDVQPHPGVWHLVSTVEGRLRPGIGDADLLRATFPPGSVTGAPKLRALTAIADLEPVPRRAYTGAIGFVSPLWGAELSVAIRTFEIEAGRIALGVGGGITADSVPMLEWRECLDKAAPLVAAARSTSTPALQSPAARPSSAQLRGGLLETILSRGGAPVRAADHLARLDRSCRELYGGGLPPDVAGRLLAVAQTHPAGRAALRVVARPDLTVEITVRPAADPAPASDLITAVRPGGVWRHKWADRAWAAGLDDALFVNDGAVLETVRGNVFLIEADGTLVTAPLTDDVLPGVTRRALLDLARDEARPTRLRRIDVAELTVRPAFWTSSLSGVVPIQRVDGVPVPRADAVIRGFAERLIGGRTAVR